MRDAYSAATIFARKDLMETGATRVSRVTLFLREQKDRAEVVYKISLFKSSGQLKRRRRAYRPFRWDYYTCSSSIPGPRYVFSLSLSLFLRENSTLARSQRFYKFDCELCKRTRHLFFYVSAASIARRKQEALLTRRK